MANLDTRRKRISMMNLASGPVLFIPPLPDGVDDAPDRLHFLGVYAGIAVGPPVTTTIVYIFLGTALPFTSKGGGTAYYEAFYRATAGTAHTRLWNLTTGAAVAGTTDSTTDGNLALQRSGEITLTDGNVYRAQFGKAGSDTGEAVGAEIVMEF